MIASESKSRWLILFGLVILAFGFHTCNLDYASYDLDEAVHIWHAQKTYAEVIEQSSHDPNPPIYNLILSTWVKLFGVSEWTTRFFSVLMGVVGVVAMFFIASRNFGLAVGITAALLYCFSPIQFRFTHLARPYSLLMVTVLFSYGLLLECIKRPNGLKLVLYFFATALMIYVHPTSVFNIPAQGLIVLILGAKELRKMAVLLSTMVAAFLTFGIWMLSIPYFERNDSMWFGPPDWEAIYFVIDRFYGSWKILLLQGVVLIALTLQTLFNKSKVKTNDMLVLATWILIPFIASITFSYLLKPVFQDKYILTVQPAIILMLAYTIHSISYRFVRVFLAVGAVLILFSSTQTKLNPEGDWKHVVKYLKPLHNDDSWVLVNPWYEYRTFSYYFDRHAYEVPDSTLKILVENQVSTAWHDMYDTLAGISKTKIVHVVRAHQGVVNREPFMDVLDTSAFLVANKDFVGINVRTYSFVEKLDTLYQELLTFDNGVNGRGLIESENEFSEPLVFSLSSSQTNGPLRVTASVELKSDESMEGVSFVVSAEEGGVSHNYQSVNVLAASESEEFVLFKNQLELKQFQNDWVIKVYVWNRTRRQFQIDNLNIVVEN